MNLIKPFIIATAVVAVLSSCTTYKSTSDLNLYNPKALEARLVSDTLYIDGMFCADQGFLDSYSRGDGIRPQFAIATGKKFSKFIRGNIWTNFEPSTPLYYKVTPEIISQYPLYQSECGLDKKHPFVYEFSIDINENYPDTKWKEVRMKEYYFIVNQIKQEKYLDVRAVMVPMLGRTAGSAQDARMYFTDEQIEKMFANDH